MATARIRAFPNSPNSVRIAMDKHFRALIAEAKDENGIKKYQMADAAHISRPTFISKVKDPGAFTLEQVRAIAELANWTAEDIAKFIIGNRK